MSDLYIEIYETLERYGYDMSIADIAEMLNVPDEWVQEVFEQMGVEDQQFGDEMQQMVDCSLLD
jgi:DNA-binding Lrp family transcriptional regulator